MKILVTCKEQLRDTYKNWLEIGGFEYAAAPVGSEIPGIEDFDALLLSGGGDVDPKFFGEKLHPATKVEDGRDALEFELTRRFLAANKPVAGICRGLQFIAVFFGGSLIQDLPDERGTSAHQLPDGDAEHWVEYYGSRIFVNSAHHQAADSLPPCLKISGRADDGVIEGIFHESLAVSAVQWHPERIAFDEIVARRLFMPNFMKKH